MWVCGGWVTLKAISWLCVGSVVGIGYSGRVVGVGSVVVGLWFGGWCFSVGGSVVVCVCFGNFFVVNFGGDSGEELVFVADGGRWLCGFTGEREKGREERELVILFNVILSI